MLGENIKNLRIKNGLSQEDLAKKLNVVRQTISKWEKGQSLPDAESLKTLAEVFSTDVSSLLGQEEKDGNDDLKELLKNINAEIHLKNQRREKFWKILGRIFLAIVIIYLLLIILNIATFESIKGGRSGLFFLVLIL